MVDTMAENLLQKPKKPMTKEEVTLLLDLVASKKVIVSKETNAATNKLKEEAWNYVTTVYNSKSRRPRHKEQLKLKWDNLKKSARKRSQQKMNKMASVDDEYSSADQLLDRVTEIFQSSSTGDIVNDSLNITESGLDCSNNVYCDTSTYVPKGKKRKFQSSDEGRLERNVAIANYYRKKSEKMSLEIELLKLEVAQRKNNTIVPKLNVMLRCRAGSDFHYNQLEMDTMLSDLAVFNAMGIDRFVFGALDNNQSIDMDSCLKVVKSASPIPVTFHRAFDVCKYPIGSLETVIKLGFNRVLTSGQKPSAVDPEAIKIIDKLTMTYGDKIQIMPGAGITSSNAGLLKKLPCKIFHGSCKKLKSRCDGLAMGSSDQSGYYVTDLDEVVKLKKALNDN